MSRWRWGWIVIGILALLVVLSRSVADDLLKDSDTILILNGIKARGAPLSWFAGDWPLGNHFYRPIVSLVFEADLALHGSNAAGFGLTNALIGGFCVLALFWFVRELTESLNLSLLSAGLFGLWHLLPKDSPLSWLGYGLAGISLLAILRPHTPKLPAVFCFCAGLALTSELPGVAFFGRGIMDWIPGRTASVMTLFCLLTMAAYASSVRVSSSKCEIKPGPLDPPATKGSLRTDLQSPLPWIALSVACVALAFGSYEQAVMLPALLIGVGLAQRVRGFQLNWMPHIAFWSVLGIYIALRFAVLPPGVSGYQAQQFRSSLSVFLTICDYAFPAAREIVVFVRSIELGMTTILLTQGGKVLAIAANVGLDIGLIRRLKAGFERVDRTLIATICFGFVGSIVAFLPMAFLKPFDSLNHYHYLAMAMRALFVAGLLVVTGEWLISGLSPRAIQAPKRLAPAPGSLPRR